MGRRAAAAAATIAGAAAGYLLVLRPRMLTWGATAQEAAAAMPGEEMLPEPRVRTTRAITIDAPCERVWPWLNQIGQDRGGLYTWTAIENLVGLQFRNADEVRPEWQLEVGDLVRFAPADSGDFGMEVLRSEAPHLLVLGALDAEPGAGLPDALWIFSLRDDGGRTRLVVRLLIDYPPSPLGHLANKWLLEPVHFVMERGMLRGLAERAEG